MREKIESGQLNAIRELLSNEDIKQILMDKTGWTAAEIQQAFASLRNPESSKTGSMENENN
jgi:hypothetical protein